MVTGKRTHAVELSHGFTCSGLQPDNEKAVESARIRERLERLAIEQKVLETRLTEIDAAESSKANEDASCETLVSNRSPPSEKIALFRSLFRGRNDVYPKRWENSKSGRSGYAPVCANEWKPPLCAKPRIKCGACPNQAFRTVSDEAISAHLLGRQVLGVYPMLQDGMCWFLAADFDKETWKADALAFFAACRSKQVPVALERSRSGNGGHVWIFFAEPVSAQLARQLGSHLLTEAMESNPDIGFTSYDRFFPSQDNLPDGGFGNLIALPLQGDPRKNNNSLFLNEAFVPYEDQWAFLSSLHRMTCAEVNALVDEASHKGRIIGLGMPLDDEDETPWTAPPSRNRALKPIEGTLPEQVGIVMADQIYIPRDGLPSGLINRLVRLAAFQNPAFYQAQAMRRSTFDTPRVIACAELLSHHIALPRGCFEAVVHLLEELGICIDLQDERNSGKPINTAFLGDLNPEQKRAASAMLSHETGVLAAATGFGKTIVAASMIATRNTNALVLVHRRQLLDQWVARLGAFLDLSSFDIGQIGGGKRKPKGFIDVATIQSLYRNNMVDDIVAEYGHLVVDECHHLSAVSFEAVVRRTRAKYVLGLSATVTRRDGHHPIIFMQCGSVRFRATAKAEACRHPFQHRAILRPTQFQLPDAGEDEKVPINAVYAALIEDEDRNTLIFEDVLQAVETGRSPIILTERKEHARQLAERLGRFARNVLLLQGGMRTKQRREVMRRIEDIPDSEERVLVATGRYIGEGFDDARLDTLFLAMPVSWKGTLAQYVGRLHRLHPEKREVLVYDYFDEAVPVLKRMGGKRIKGYESLGYIVDRPDRLI